MPAPKGGNKGSFKKGRSGNPAGRKPLPSELKEARNMAYDDMCRTVIEVRNMSLNDIKKLSKMDLPLGKRAIINAYRKFDYRGIKDYEDRLFGKAIESHRLVDGDGNDMNPTLVISSDFLPQSE